MAAFASVASGLHAALLFARGRPEGLAYVEAGLAGARRSFWAAAICLPLFAALRLLDWGGAVPAQAVHEAGLDLAGYAVGWAGFALLSRRLAAGLGREERWPRFIAAWNWCNVAQYVLLLGAAVPGVFGAPDWLQEAAGLIALGWAVWLEWYVARLTLDIGALPAALVAGTDLMIGVALAGFTAALLGR